jgi:hypothetical protein
MGDWVSGIGALLAVISSFILVRRSESSQREREREKIQIEQWGEGFFCSVRVISNGLFPCRIKGVFFIGPDGPNAGAVPLGPHMAETGRIDLPQRLEYREDLQFAWRVDTLDGLLRALSHLGLRRMDALSIQVVTVTSEFTVPVSTEFSEYLIGAAAAARIEVITPDES